MIKYAFYIRPDDIYSVFHMLKDANAKWAGWSRCPDFMEESIDVIKSHGYDKNGMAAYIKFVGENPKILMQHSSVDYLNSNARMISNEGYNIVDNIYLVPQFRESVQYDELETNDTNFFDI